MNTMLNKDLVEVTTLACVICFNRRAYNIKLSTEESDQIFKNCVNYLDTSLKIESPKPETQLTFCRDCYNQEFYITQCTEKLTAIQKEISDSRSLFSLDVLLRRKQCKEYCKTNTNNHQSTLNAIELQSNISPTTTDDIEIGAQLTSQTTILTAKELSVPNIEKDRSINESVIEDSENQKGCLNFEDAGFDTVHANHKDIKAGEIDRTDDEKHQSQSKPPSEPSHHQLPSSSQECPGDILIQEDLQESFDDTRGEKINEKKEIQSELVKKEIQSELVKKEIQSELVKKEIQSKLVKKEIQSELVSQDGTSLEYQRDRNLQVHGERHENTPAKREDTNKTVGNEIDGFEDMSVRVAISSFQNLNLIKTISLPTIRLERLHVDENQPKDETSCPKQSESEFEKDFGNAQTKVKLEEKSKDIEKAAFKCLICPKSFLFLSALKSHSAIHTKQKPYKCSRCKKVFRRKCELAKHKQFHTKEVQGGHKCPLCGKMCINTIYLKYHMGSHTGERHFKCSTCEKSFQFFSTLEEHKRIHFIEKRLIKAPLVKRLTVKGRLKKSYLIY